MEDKYSVDNIPAKVEIQRAKVDELRILNNNNLSLKKLITSNFRIFYVGFKSIFNKRW